MTGQCPVRRDTAKDARHRAERMARLREEFERRPKLMNRRERRALTRDPDFRAMARQNPGFAEEPRPVPRMDIVRSRNSW